MLLHQIVPHESGSTLRMMYQRAEGKISASDWLRETACAFLPILVSMVQPHSSANSLSAQAGLCVAGEATARSWIRADFSARTKF